MDRAIDFGCSANGNMASVPSTPEAIQWQGWGTALKPAWEPICLARKPFKGTVAANVLEHGTGTINVDGCRVGTDTVTINTFDDGAKPFGNGAGHEFTSRQSQGRWPANLILDEEAGAMLDEQSGELDKPGNKAGVPTQMGVGNNVKFSSKSIVDGSKFQFGDSGGASRFFYCAKTSQAERNAGLEGTGAITDDGRAKPIDNPYLRGETLRQNNHPTVKPLSLMQWLVRLVTPPGGIVIDPFMGSGTTGMACVTQGFEFIGIE